MYCTISGSQNQPLILLFAPYTLFFDKNEKKVLTNKQSSAIITDVAEIATCEGGGIGRRARLRGVWVKPCRFKSGPSHQKPTAL